VDGGDWHITARMLQEVNGLPRKIINGDRVDLSREKTTTTCYVERYTTNMKLL